MPIRTTITTSALAALSLTLATSQAAVARDNLRPVTTSATAASTMKAAKSAPDPRPPLPPRPAGLQSGDQIQLIYDARTKSPSFGRIVAIKKANDPPAPVTNIKINDHRGKTATKPPSTPPGTPPPAAPPSAVSGPPAAPPGTVSTPPASGKVVRTHDKDVYPNITSTKVKDHREGFGGDTYERKSFRTVTGMTVTVKPRQKPPCYGDACWFFGR